MAKKETEVTKEFCLEDILSNESEIGKSEEKEVTITHKRLNADFTFLVPELKDLSKIQDKNGSMVIDEVYKALSINLLTKIDDKMLKALKVTSQVEGIKKLFTSDETLMLMASLMEGLEDKSIVIKKK